MSAILEGLSAHPAGEITKSSMAGESSWPLDTPGGRFYAEWDTEAPTSREGQLIFFFQFLKAGGRWEQFMKHCPLEYTGNRGSGALNVMGTVLLECALRTLALRAYQQCSGRHHQPLAPGHGSHGQ